MCVWRASSLHFSSSFKWLPSKLENNSDAVIPCQTFDTLLSDLPRLRSDVKWLCLHGSVCLPLLTPSFSVRGQRISSKGFLPGISSEAYNAKSCTCLQKRSDPPHKHIALWIVIEKIPQFCDNKMAISDLQGAVWNQIKHVIGDSDTAVVCNRALCQLLRQSFHQARRITEAHSDYLSTLCCKNTCWFGRRRKHLGKGLVSTKST